MGKFDETKQRADLKEYADGNLEPRGRNTYVCPICGSGNGPNRTAALTIQPDKGQWRCFSCGHGGDVFDLAGAIHGTEDKREQLSLVAEWFGLEDGTGGHERPPKPAQRTASTKGAAHAVEDHTEGRAASRAYVEAMRANITNPEAVAYLQARGLTLEDAERFGLGYDPNAGGARDERGNWCRRGRIVIPWRGSDYYHIDRSIDTAAKDGKYIKPKAADVGPQPLWNRDVIGSGRPYFVVEGALDALAIEAVGGEAVALGGTGAEQFISAAALHKSATMPILMLDNDEPGRAAQASLEARLDAEGIGHTVALPLVGEDAAEWLEKSRDGMEMFVPFIIDEAYQVAEVTRERAYSQAMRKLQVRDTADVAHGILDLEDMRETIGTGLVDLDITLGGGLPSSGLVALGAVSSTGKTTFAVQIADHMAAEGRPVLFVTIEQSAQEIVAKSISRIMATRTRESGGGLQASAQHILTGSTRKRWQTSDPEKQAALEYACAEYERSIAANMHILEGMRQPKVSDVRAVAERMAEHDGQAPLVFIDYLQLLAPQDERDTDKRAVDRNVMSLRQMARDLDTLVFTISSLNRSSYSGAVDMESFKESGAVEYGSDVLLGLQPRDMTVALDGKRDDTAKKAEAKKRMREFKRAVDREAEVVIIKNRNGGGAGTTVPLRYNALTNTFTDERSSRS